MDRITTMQAFVSVVADGGFSRAADKLGLSPQVVSKYVAQLEAHLQTRLLNRTTRRVHLTEAGQAYFERCRQVLEDIDDMEGRLLNLQGQVTGRLNISAPLSFGMRYLADLLVEFQRSFPDVTVNLQLNDRRVDLIDEGFDVALRIGHLQSSSMVAKLIKPIRLVCCASPEYLQRHGEPFKPEQLQGHRYLKYTLSAVVATQLAGQEVPSVFESNNGDVLVRAAINGAGIVIQPDFLVADAIAAGHLQPILSNHEPEPMGLYALYAHRAFLSAKVRSFIDFVGDFFVES